MDAARRLQDLVEQPARTAARAPAHAGLRLPSRLRPGPAADDASPDMPRDVTRSPANG
jgi:hypothetical protein